MPFELGFVRAVAVDHDRPCIGLRESGNDVHQRRLATAGRTDDRDELAVADGEADAFNDGQRP